MEEKWRDWMPYFQAVQEEVDRRVDRLVEQFSASLKDWLEDMLNHPIPDDWPVDLDRFVQHSEYYGIAIRPHSIRDIGRLIEARKNGTGPFAGAPLPAGESAPIKRPPLVLALSTEANAPATPPETDGIGAEERKQLLQVARRAAYLEQQRISLSDDESARYEYYLYQNFLRRRRGEPPLEHPQFWHDKNDAFNQRRRGGLLRVRELASAATSEAEAIETPKSGSSETPLAGTEAPAAAKQKSSDWPKLTADEIDRIERDAGRRWWYPFVPAGETDWIWLNKLERGAQEARLALLEFYRELAALGRMGRDANDNEELDVAKFSAQQERVQRAYDRYIKSLIPIEITWKEYLQRVILMIGVHVIALKEKIDRALPSHLDGFHSSAEDEFKNEVRQGAEALRVAPGRVERGYTVFVWTDRGIIAAQFALPLVAGAKLVFTTSVRQGLSKAAALRAAIAYTVSRVAIATAQGAVAGEIIPRVLQGMGIDEADARAGVTIFLSLIALRSAITESAGSGPSKKLNPATRTSPRPLKLPDAVLKFWVKFVEFQGVKIYQRDEWINPKLKLKGRTKLQRMQAGEAPIGADGWPLQLHHLLQTEEGALAEVTREFHMTHSQTVHINPSSTPSGIDRASFRVFRAQYWKRRAVDFGGGVP